MTAADTGESSADLLSAGRQALAEGAWEKARACFEEAVAERETPEALEGLSWAAWWQNDQKTLFDARNRAYRMYRERGDRLGAGRVAAWLASDHVDFRGEEAIANGWLRRARRLLAECELSAEHGWMAVLEADIALCTSGDLSAAKRAAREGLEIGRLLGITDLEVVGLAVEGIALVSEGQITDGMARLDEAATAALAGELQELFSVPWAVCYLIQACERVRDYDRAAQWCARMKEYAARFHIRFITGVCRAQYGGVLLWRGEWGEAEAELRAAADDLAATRPLSAAEGLARLGELRRRQGRVEEAIDLFNRAQSHPLAALGLAEIALQQGQAREAEERLDRRLRHLSPVDWTGRTAALELLVRVYVAAGDHTRAEDTLNSLRSVAEEVGTEPLQAAAHHATGIVAMAREDHDQARRHFEDAVFLYGRSGGAYEVARARVELAGALVALGRATAAGHEARLALNTLEEMGAAPEAERAAALLRRLRAGERAHQADADAVGGLTPRELEVLRLVAQGLTDRDIAGRLVLSEHTVHRHMANVLSKLNLSSRAAAVAYAVRNGML